MDCSSDSAEASPAYRTQPVPSDCVFLRNPPPDVVDMRSVDNDYVFAHKKETDTQNLGHPFPDIREILKQELVYLLLYIFTDILVSFSSKVS